MTSTFDTNQVPSRAQLNPALIAAVRASGCPVRRLASLAGFTRPNELSDFLCRDADTIPLTDLNVRRLRALAGLVGLDRDQIFLTGGSHHSIGQETSR